MSEDSDFSLENSDSDSPKVATAKPTDIAAAGAIGRKEVDVDDEFDINVSLEAEPQDSLPLPELSPSHGKKADFKSLLKNKKNLKADYRSLEFEAFQAPVSPPKWAASKSISTSQKKPKKPPAGYADQLYSKKAKVEEKIEKLRQVKNAEEEAKCSFKPTVNPSDAGPRSFDDFLSQQKKKGEERDKKLMRLKMDLEAQHEDKETTHKPQILKKSAKLAERRSLPTHDSLHLSAKSALQRSINQHLKSKELSPEQPSRPFVPSINRPSTTASISEAVKESVIKDTQSKQSNVKDSTTRPASVNVSKSAAKVLVEKLTREFAEQLAVIAPDSERLNYSQTRELLQRLRFLKTTPSESEEQQEREQLIALWHSLDPEKQGEVTKDRLFDALLQISSSSTKEAKAYTLLYINRKELKKAKEEVVLSSPSRASTEDRHGGKSIADALIKEGKEWQQRRQELQRSHTENEAKLFDFKPKTNSKRIKSQAIQRPNEMMLILKEHQTECKNLPRTELLYQLAKRLKDHKNEKIQRNEHLKAAEETYEFMPDFSLSNKLLLQSEIPVAGKEKAVKRLREASMQSELKKKALETGHTTNAKKLEKLSVTVTPKTKPLTNKSKSPVKPRVPKVRTPKAPAAKSSNQPKPGAPISTPTLPAVPVKVSLNTPITLPSQPIQEFTPASPVVDEPVLTITVNLSAEESDQLVVYSEEDLSQAVEDFITKHNLPPHKRYQLEEMVQSYFNSINPAEGSEGSDYNPQLDEVVEVSAEALESSEVKEEAQENESLDQSPVRLDEVNEESETDELEVESHDHRTETEIGEVAVPEQILHPEPEVPDETKVYEAAEVIETQGVDLEIDRRESTEIDYKTFTDGIEPPSDQKVEFPVQLTEEVGYTSTTEIPEEAAQGALLEEIVDDAGESSEPPTLNYMEEAKEVSVELKVFEPPETTIEEIGETPKDIEKQDHQEEHLGEPKEIPAISKSLEQQQEESLAEFPPLTVELQEEPLAESHPLLLEEPVDIVKSGKIPLDELLKLEDLVASAEDTPRLTFEPSEAASVEVSDHPEKTPSLIESLIATEEPETSGLPAEAQDN